MIEPSFPSKVADSSVADRSITPDAAIVDADIEVDAAVEPLDLGVTDAMVTPDAMLPPQRTCQNWLDCYAGETCLSSGDDTLSCQPSAESMDCGENLQTPREFSVEQGCCLPNESEQRGNCVFPYTIDFEVRSELLLESPFDVGIQFSGGTCLSEVANSVAQADLVMLVNFNEPPMDTPMICLEISPPSGILAQGYVLESCCEETQSYPSSGCGFPDSTPDSNRQFVNVPYTNQSEVRFGVRVHSTDGRPDEPTIAYKVHAAACCSESIPCGGEGTCQNGLCE